jgi:hypothetical protein
MLRFDKALLNPLNDSYMDRCMVAKGLNVKVSEVEKKIQNPKNSKTRNSKRKHAKSGSGAN